MKPTPEPILDAELTDAMASAIAPLELSSQQRDRMRARILNRVSAPPPASMSTLRGTEGSWEEMAPGIHIKTLYVEKVSNTRTFLLRMQPGSRVPVHSHTQEEQCLVLDGEVKIGEHVVRSGDFHVALPGSSHDDFYSPFGCLIFVRAEIPHSAGA